MLIGGGGGGGWGQVDSPAYYGNQHIHLIKTQTN